MLIALLAVLGVDLIVLLVVGAIVVGRRRWLKKQAGEFFGAVRLTRGEIHGFKSKWNRGSGRWVRDVFVWSQGPFLYRDYLVPVDSATAARTARPGEVKRLGDDAVVIGFASGDAMIEVAAKREDRDRVIGSLATRAHFRVPAVNLASERRSSMAVETKKPQYRARPVRRRRLG